MDVSGPVFAPVRAEIADIFDPISKPASFVFASFTGPAITIWVTGPDMVRSAERVPPCSDEPEGKVTPRAGSRVLRSLTGMLSALSFIFKTGADPRKS